MVDRKDLDRQTREEFNKFQEGSVEENTNTEALVKRLLSTDYADKVIVTTIQKLGLALDGSSSRNYTQRLEPLSKKRVVFIFDECHRSQFGENHKAIKAFFPQAQLFGFTGTPIFEDNATYKTREEKTARLQTTEDIFEKQLHAYTITHAIDDRNVLRFHVDYFRGKGNQNPKPGEPIAQQAVAEAIISKHNTATNQRKFNAVLATASINNAIEYYRLFKTLQQQLLLADANYVPLNIACVFSPPPQLIAKDGDQQSQKNAADIKQLQDDLTQEKEDNLQNPEEKKKALTEIIADYNAQFNTNHSISEFDLYYKDVQWRIKAQKYSNKEYPQQNKIDITIVVDMLLTGFDSKYLNTLYVDKNLKYHGLIQAFSRTNRVLNDTKPYGNILDFRHQQEAVKQAIMLFCGMDGEQAREIWMVESAEEMLEQFKQAVAALGVFMQEQNVASEPDGVYNLRGDTAKYTFIKNFKEVQRIKTRLDQYTDLSPADTDKIAAILPEPQYLAFKSSYLETAKQLRVIQQQEGNDAEDALQQLDFEFVLFATAIIDFDFIMGLVADSTQPKPAREKMSKEQIIKLIKAEANLMDEEEDLKDYINSLDWNSGKDINALKTGFEAFKADKYDKELAAIARQHGLETNRLKAFVAQIMSRLIFDGENLTDLLEPLNLSWKERRVKELALMADLLPQLKKLADGRVIAGLIAYE